MSDKMRPLLAGTVIGALAAGLLAVPTLLPPAMADEQPMKSLLSTAEELWPTPFDTSKLVKFDFTVEPSVSTDVQRTSTVRKIGYGRTTFVSIAETATGTYSSDGLTSPHIRYPGIHVEQQRSEGSIGKLMLLANGGWVAGRDLEAGSFVSVTAFEGGKLLMTDSGSCVLVRGAAYC